MNLLTDLLISLLMTCAYFIFKSKINSHSKRIKTSTLSVKKYTLWVKRLPSEGLTKKEVFEFFNKFS